MRSLAWIVGFGLFVLLCWFCTTQHAPRIEADITRRAQSALEVAGLDPGLITIDGRDGCLALAEGSAHLRGALDALNTVRGLRVVNTGCGASLAIASGLAAPFFRAERAADEIVIEGALDEAAARAAYGAVDALAPRLPVARRITTSDVAAAGWTDGLPAAIRLVSARALDPALTIESAVVTVSGRVPSEAARTALLTGLKELFPGQSVVDRLELRPPENASELQRGLDQFVASRVVEFDFDSDALTSAGRSMLEEVAELLASLPSLRIAIEGHTDNVGEPAFNQELSERRANAVRAYLVQWGLAADRFETAGYGENRPVADNSTPEGRQKNRRTEFRVVEES